MRACLALTLVAASLCPAGAAGSPAGAAQRSHAAARVETFETVWRIVDEKFYDPTFNGVDWDAVRERYAPRAAAAKSDEELYALLNEMLGELRVSHFGILPPQSLVETSTDPDDASWGGTAGMTVRMLDGLAVVTAVEAGGGAEVAGLRPGYVVTRVGSLDVAEAYRRAAAGGVSETARRFLTRRAIRAALGGMHGSAVEVAYLDANDRPKLARVIRHEVTGVPVRFGDLPTVVARVDARRLRGGVGYVAFNAFLRPMLDEIRDAVASLRDAEAIVVDLRGNPGGDGLMAPMVASLFVSERMPLGTMKMRRAEMRFVTVRQPAPYAGRLVFLVDEATASTSEILAGALQESGRATVVGEPSLGAVLPSVVEKLPNGAVFQYAVADFRTPKGVLLEGRGVRPDVLVTPARADYLAGRDPALEAALAYLKGNRVQVTSKEPRESSGE